VGPHSSGDQREEGVYRGAERDGPLRTVASGGDGSATRRTLSSQPLVRLVRGASVQPVMGSLPGLLTIFPLIFGLLGLFLPLHVFLSFFMILKFPPVFRKNFSPDFGFFFAADSGVVSFLPDLRLFFPILSPFSDFVFFVSFQI